MAAGRVASMILPVPIATTACRAQLLRLTQVLYPDSSSPPLHWLSMSLKRESVQLMGVVRVVCSSMPAMSRLLRPISRLRAASGMV